MKSLRKYFAYWIAGTVLLLLIGAAAYARHQHVQAELAAQQNVLHRIAQGFDGWKEDFGGRFDDIRSSISDGYRNWSEEIGNRVDVLSGGIGHGFASWRDDLTQRLHDARKGIVNTGKDMDGVIGGTWWFIAFVVTVFLDILGNLHIMIPVAIIYFVTGFFGSLKTRFATVIAMLVAVILADKIGIVPGSILGILLIIGLLFANRIASLVSKTVPNLRPGSQPD